MRGYGMNFFGDFFTPLERQTTDIDPGILERAFATLAPHQITPFTPIKLDETFLMSQTREVDFSLTKLEAAVDLEPARVSVFAPSVFRKATRTIAHAAVSDIPDELKERLISALSEMASRAMALSKSAFMAQPRRSMKVDLREAAEKALKEGNIDRGLTLLAMARRLAGPEGDTEIEVLSRVATKMSGRPPLTFLY